MTGATGCAPLALGIVTVSISRRAGGLFESVRFPTLGLAKAGNKIDVFSVTDDRTEDDLKAWTPIVPKMFTAIGPRRLAYVPALRKALLSDLPDLVHQHGLWRYLSVAVSAFRARTGRPTVISPRGMLDPWALQNGGWKKRIARTLYQDRSLQGAACLHALNDSEAASIRALGLRNPIAVIPNGVNLPDPEDASAPRPAFLGANDRQVLLFIGRIHPKKGLAETVDAWAVLKQIAPDVARSWRLVVAGWGDDDHRIGLAQRVNELGLADDVTFHGPVFGPEKEAALNHADAFILASHSEGLPMAILEAWAHRLPVFMSRACNLPEGFAAGAAVEISTETVSIASTLAERLADPDLSTIGDAGRALVEVCFTWDAVVSEQMRVYEWLVRGAPPPNCVTLR